jgi:hypothetical protein
MAKTSDYGSSPGDAASDIAALRFALSEACDIALGTELSRQAAERIRELQKLAHPH